MDIGNFDEDEAPEGFDQCPTCRGDGTVNPLTAPRFHFAAGVSDCPTCGGDGRI